LYNTLNMKKSFGLLILLILFSAGCACPSAQSTPSPKPMPSPQPSPKVSPEYAEWLAKQFCPIIYLKGEGETTENFDPEQIEIMVDKAFLRDVKDPAFSKKATLSSLLQWSKSIYYLDLMGLEPNPHSLTEYKLAYDKVKEQYQHTLYARVREGGGGSYTVVQYWIFYYFNDWRNCHEGDWELVQLCFPGYTAKELLAKGELPVFVAYSQHQSGQKMSWSSMRDKSLVVDTHPIVYVAQGSHANYFTPGNSWSGLDFDDTGLSSWRVINPEQFKVVLLPEIEAEGAGLEWLRFQGYWGEYLGFSVSVLGLKFWQRGPFGPPWSEGERTNQKWEHPEEWAAGLPEYPEPFWTSFFKLPGDWFNRAFFCLFSPANIHVYDSMGRHVGVNKKGEIETQIPGAVYIAPEGTQYKTIVIPNADVSQEYALIVEGTGSGTMEIKAQVPDTKNKVKRYLEYTNVPVSATTKARVKIKPDVSIPRITTQGDSVRDKVTKLELDSDGNGAFELESTSGNFEKQRQKVVQSVLKANIDIEPDTLDLSSVVREKSITAYIELPAGYNPKGIDISTVRLMKDIPAWERPVDVVDHDQDGIYELMVQFDRQLVIAYLEKARQLEGKVSLTLSGVVDGRQFEGTDIIILTRGTKQTQSNQSGAK